MALGVLEIIYIAIIIIAVIIQTLLYRFKSESKNSIFIINMIFGVALSWLAYTSFAINFTGQRALAIIYGIVAILAIIIKLKTNKVIVSKIMLSVSIIASLVLLFL